ncbi:MAG: hypothetical protein KGJ13_09790, partial [Patescibacteria group bacterium]|nr:hypothetical protein [Patescibacteria group bacterium]
NFGSHQSITFLAGLVVPTSFFGSHGLNNNGSFLGSVFVIGFNLLILVSPSVMQHTGKEHGNGKERSHALSFPCRPVHDHGR